MTAHADRIQMEMSSTFRSGPPSTEPRPAGLGADPTELTVPFTPSRRDEGDGPPPRPDHSDTGAVSTRTIVFQALAFAAVTRIILIGIAWWSVRIFGKRELYPAQLPDRFIPDSSILDGLARWDTSHYVAVARLGYGEGNPSHEGGLGFFPVFPMLMRGATEVIGAAPTERNLAIAAIVIANLCFIGCVALIAATSARWGADFARTTTAIFCLSPFAFFFNVAYTESLFLLLSLGALALMERRHVWPATALAAVASGTRLVGLALTPALLWSAWKRGASRRELAGILVLSPMGTLAYFAYTAIQFDDPLAYFSAQSNWGGWDEHVRFYVELFLRQPKEAIAGDPRHLVIVLNVALGVLALGLLTQMRGVVEPGLMVFTLLLVVVQFAFTWVSLGRYLLPAAGLYLAFAALFARPALRTWPRDAVFAVSTMLLGILTALFAHGFWVV